MLLWVDQAVPLLVLFMGLSRGYSQMAIRPEYPIQCDFTHMSEALARISPPPSLSVSPSPLLPPLSTWSVHVAC